MADSPKRTRTPKSDADRDALAATASFAMVLDYAGPRTAGDRAPKQRYATRFSKAAAQLIANMLRLDRRFATVLPDSSGRFHESSAGAARKPKKLDVNFSTPELGLALGISIKSVNFAEGDRGYAHNVTGRDYELRAEATDYHTRQPYAVMIAVYLVPFDSCDDGRRPGSTSSFGRLARHMRLRAGRERPNDPPDQFEQVFIGLYEPEGPHRGHVAFFDVMRDPPRQRRPRQSELLTLEQLIERIGCEYSKRNDPAFRWAED